MTKVDVILKKVKNRFLIIGSFYPPKILAFGPSEMRIIWLFGANIYRFAIYLSCVSHALTWFRERVRHFPGGFN